MNKFLVSVFSFLILSLSACTTEPTSSLLQSPMSESTSISDSDFNQIPLPKNCFVRNISTTSAVNFGLNLVIHCVDGRVFYKMNINR